VQLDVGLLGLTTEEAIPRLAAEGVALSSTVHSNVLRAVTHLDVSRGDVERAAHIIIEELR
jgi:hypothetical protein